MSATQSVRSLPDQTPADSALLSIALPDLPLPVTIRPARLLSDEELLDFCAANDGLEIEANSDGSIVVMTPAGPEISRLNQILSGELMLWTRKTGRGAVFGPDLGIRFPDMTLRAPDVAWLSNERWNAVRERRKKRPAFLTFCPEFVAELRSPSDRASQVEAKMEFWMARGAQLGWLIDPKRRLAIIYRPDNQVETLLRPAVLEGEGPIQGFRIEMSEFWE
jgi:Uma2 family endonuclease